MKKAGFWCTAMLLAVATPYVTGTYVFSADPICEKADIRFRLSEPKQTYPKNGFGMPGARCAKVTARFPKIAGGSLSVWHAAGEAQSHSETR